MTLKSLVTTALLFIFTLSSGVCQISLSSEDKKAIITEKYLQGVYEANVTRNSEKAAVLFAEILKIDSTHSAAHYMLSRVHSSHKEMLRHIIDAHKYDSTNIWYQTSLTDKYRQSKMYDDAIKVAKSTLKTNPDNIGSYPNLVTLYLYKKDFENAEKVIDNFEQKYGMTEESMLSRIQVYQSSPISDTIITKLKQMAENDPSNAIPLIVLGERYMELKKHDEALKYYKQAEAIDNTNIKLIILLSDYYLITKDLDNLVVYMKKGYAIKQLPVEPKIAFIEEVLFSAYFYDKHFLKISDLVHSLLQNYPNNLAVNNTVAQHYINSRLLDKAGQQYLDIIEKGIANEETYYNLIGLKSYQKQFDSIIVYCDKMIEVYPETKSQNTMQKSYAYMSMKQFDKAISIIQEIIRSTKEKEALSEMYGMIGDIYHEWEKSDESYSNYKKALRYDPNNVPVLNNYSYHLSVENKQLKKALTMIKKVIEAEPENSTYLDTYGWILYQMGDYEAAAEILKDAVDKDTSHSDVILMHYGDALYKIGKKITAKLYWTKALENGADEKEIAQRMKLP